MSSMQSNITCRIDFVPLLLITLYFTGCGPVVNVPHAQEGSITIKNGGSSSSQKFNKLLLRTQAAGSIRIIVRLNMLFVPDSQLSAQAAMDQQTRISGMQDQLCAEISQYDVKGVKRFKYTPYIAMEVDSMALKALMSNLLVLSVDEDIPALPRPH